MAKENVKRILVVDSDRDRSSKTAHQLEFVDYQAKQLTSPDFLPEMGDLKDFMAVLIANRPALIDLHQKVLEAHEQAPPFILMQSGEKLDFTADELAEHFLGTISSELRYSELENVLHKAEVMANAPAESREKTTISTHPELFRSLVGNSRYVTQVRKMIEKVAPSEANVLILGESGTGKEVVARNIHYFSQRRGAPFVPINCGAIPGELLESELFGHEKGSFTGAFAARKGRFEMAQGGTIFLDEIGDMPMPMQVKLLRVLQERTFERVGSNSSIEADVRVVAATHRDLERLIEEGKFREDLYYRLNVFPIQMPSLRERLEDLPLLVNELITRLEHEKNASVRLTPAATMALCQYKWPGNVRELANLIERLTILHPYGVVDTPDLPEKIVPDNADLEDRPDGMPAVDLPGSGPKLSMLNEPRLPRDGIDLKQHLTDIEVSLIHQALDDCKGVVAHAAKKLGIRRTTLVEKMRKYNISRVEEA